MAAMHWPVVSSPSWRYALASVVVGATAVVGAWIAIVERTASSDATHGCGSPKACLRSLAGSGALPSPCSLLTGAEVAPFIGGPFQQRVASRERGVRSCTWSSPPLGYMQSRHSFTLQIFKASRATFKEIAKRSIPPWTPVVGVGAPAYAGMNDLEAWKHGVIVELDSSTLNVYPNQVRQAARTVLKQLP